MDMYTDEPLMDGEAEVGIDTEGSSCEGDEEGLKRDDGGDNDQENRVLRDTVENVELNSKNSTYSCSLRALRKLKACIMTKVLKTKVKCLEGTPVMSNTLW